MKVQIYALALLCLVAAVYALDECPAVDGEWAVSIGNPANCSTWFACDSGKPILKECPEGLEYNAETGVCDWPDAANCVVAETSEEEGASSETEQDST